MNKKFGLAAICMVLMTALPSCYDKEKGMEIIAGWWYVEEISEDTTVICKPCPIEMRFTHCTSIIEECPCTTIFHGGDTTYYTPGTYALSADGRWLKLGTDSFYIHEINAKEVTYGSSPSAEKTWKNVLKRP